MLAALSFAQDVKPGETAGQSKKFKNIRVLKEIPADQLIPMMHTWSTSLAVKCDVCHDIHADGTGFDLDTNPEKQKAREMYLMMTDIKKHQKTPGGKASCFMSYRGSITVVEACSDDRLSGR